MEQAGTSTQAADTGSVDRQLEAAELRLQQMEAALNTFFAGLTGRVDQLNEEAGQSPAVLNGFSAALGKVGSAIKSVLSKVGQLAKKGFATLTSKVKEAVKGVSSFGKTSSTSLKSILKYGVGIQSLYTLFNRLRSAMTEGYENLAQYSSTVNSSISSVMNALTKLKNTFAAAFAPILNVVAPILTTLINLLARAINYVGMFIATLTGQSSYTKATEVNEDYAASLSGTADSASDAADATRDAADAADDYLSGLDEISRFSTDSSSSSGSSGSSGGGSGGSSGSSMFEQVAIDSAISNMANQIKALFQAQDWKGLGTAIINTGLQKIYDAINWETVGPQITAFITAFTTTLNSLVDGVDFDLLGRTVAAGVNTIFSSLSLLVTGISWDNIGAQLGTAVDGLASNINWDTLGSTLAEIKLIVPRVLYNAITTINWSTVSGGLSTGISSAFTTVANWLGSLDGKEIAKAVTDFFDGINWTSLGSSSTKLINNFIGVFEDFVAGLVDWWSGVDKLEMFSAIMNWLNSIDWAGLASGLWDLLVMLVEVVAIGLGSIVTQLFVWIGEAVYSGWEWLSDKVSSIADKIGDTFGVIGEWISGIIADPIAFLTGDYDFDLVAELSAVWSDDDAYEELTGVDGAEYEAEVSMENTTSEDELLSIYDGAEIEAAVKNTTTKRQLSNQVGKVSINSELDNSTTAADIEEDIGDVSLYSDLLNQTSATDIANGVGTVDVNSTLNNQTTNNQLASSVGTVNVNSTLNNQTTKSQLAKSIGTVSVDANVTPKSTKKLTLKTLVDTSKTLALKISANGQTITGAKMIVAARGGIINAATLFGGRLLAGEAGKEALVPLERHTEWADVVATQMAGKLARMGGGNLGGLLTGIRSVHSSITSGINRVIGAIRQSGVRTPALATAALSGSGPSVRTRVPYLASGAVIPPNAPFAAVLGDQKNGQNLEAPASLLKSIVGEELDKRLSGKGGQYTFTAQLNRKTIFSEVIEEGKLQQTRTGHNPFDL